VPSYNATERGGVPAFMQHFKPLTAWEMERQNMGYRNRSSSAVDLDRLLGVVLDGLQAAGVADSTYVFFTSDNGYHLGEHGLWQKRSLFEESARVPLVIAAPAGRSGAVATHTVELVDVCPTLCDLAGVPLPAGIDGRSLAPLVRADAAARRTRRSKSLGTSCRSCCLQGPRAQPLRGARPRGPRAALHVSWPTHVFSLRGGRDGLPR
jgi:hypothetical protein